MSDLIQLGIGERPWLPTPSTESIEVFDRYDMPTLGLIRQAGNLYVFECLEGVLMAGSVWVYASVSAREAEQLRSSEGDNFLALISECFTHRPIMASLAINARIRSGAQVDAATIEAVGLLEAVIKELGRGIKIASDTKNAMTELAHC
ncbi:hypothetical protein [Herbidospora cretacea]|uniref:hypothetical protein n=1 Tax=Herbidospora cretacea TaxID=28444 RepID=UPI0007743288|nr:hypothetical protein [Herbidospora cretacea]